jgi:PHP family Zn ribbon phosphoesterase
MTPNNIVNMALLKGLDIISVTDHNSAENLRAVMNCACGKNLIVIPGMEIETREEVHIVCMFPSLEAALKMQDIIYNALPGLKNREEIFGQQIVMDENDNITGFNERLLLTAADISVEDVFKQVRLMEGVAIPAHVDRNSYSVISNLGSIPENLGIKCLEVSRNCDMVSLRESYPDIIKYTLIKSSDAHNLGDILEREHFIELSELNIKSLFSRLRFGEE